MNAKRNRHLVLAAGGIALALGLSACAGGGDSGGGGSDGELAGAELTVGSKEFTESIILGYLAQAALEDAGAKVEDQTGISGSATVREALESGEIDLYWDYTGTGWVNYLGNTTENLPEDLAGAVAEGDAENGIAWLTPANFENTYAVAASEEFAEKNDITTMSDVATFVKENPEEGAICAASEFINRDDGLPGLEKAYGFEFSEVVELDLNLVYSQIDDSCSFGEVTSTDARNLSNNLRVIQDDQKFFVPYDAAVTLRQETLDKYPAIADILAPISEALTGDVMTELNGLVDNDGEDPQDVATEWLEEQGFIG